MQPTLMPRTETSNNGYNAPRIPLPLGPVSPLPQGPRTHAPSADSHLRDIPSRQAASDLDLDQEINLEPGPGIFMGLRVALMFNAGLGVAALLVYEAWTMLAH